MPIRDEAINVFMGFPGDGARIDLSNNHGIDSYELGTGYNHIAISAHDLDGMPARGWPRRGSSPRSAVPVGGRASKIDAASRVVRCAAPSAHS